MKKKIINQGEVRPPATVASATPLPEPANRKVPYALVRPDPNQPRKTFSEQSLQELADSIRERGILQDLVLEWMPAKFRLCEPDLHRKGWAVEELEPDGTWALRCEDTEAECRIFLQEQGRENLSEYFRIVCGERRWRAAGMVGLTELPAKVYTGLTHEQRFAMQFIENNQRENITALEEAAALARQLEERKRADAAFSPEKLAAELGMSRAGIYERLKLNRLQPAIRQALVAGTISTSIAGEIAKVPTPKMQGEVLKALKERSEWRPMSVREVQRHIEMHCVKPLADAPFDVKLTYGNSNDLLQPCAACPHRTANMVAEFPDLKSRPNVCTNLECYQKKVKEAGEQVAAQRALEGIGTLPTAEYEKNYTKFVQASDTNYRAPGCKTWGTLMGKHRPKPVLVLTDEGPLEVFRMEEAQLALKANGVHLSGGANGYSKERAEQAKRQKKEQEMKATAGAAAPAIFRKLVGDKEPALPVALWRLLATAAFDHGSIDQHDFVAKRRGLSQRMNDSREALQKWLKAEHTAAECAAFVLDVLLISRWNGGGYHKVEWDDAFLELCTLAGGTPDKLAVMKPAKVKTLSAGARARIVAAQKARWAKIRAAAGK